MLVALDSNCFTYFNDALFEGREPIGDLAEEKKALFRIFLYITGYFWISPTVEDEWKDTKNIDRRVEFEQTDSVRCCYFNPRPECNLVEQRATELNKFHTGKKNFPDCKIVAECELYGMEVLLSYDKDLVDRLSDKTKSLLLMEPSSYWDSLNIKKGSEYVCSPHFTNPHSFTNWWIW